MQTALRSGSKDNELSVQVSCRRLGRRTAVPETPHALGVTSLKRRLSLTPRPSHPTPARHDIGFSAAWRG